MVDESVKFAWAFLLFHGKITNGKWNFYGGSWEATGNRYKDAKEIAEELTKLREKVSSVGIDWTATKIPTVKDESVFNGTFDESSNVLATLGKLVLRNGKTFLIGSSKNEAAHLVETARQIINKNNSAVLQLASLI